MYANKQPVSENWALN